jgi:hypothetical protein
MNPQDPQVALNLLNQLQSLGFDDKDFARLHHNQNQKHPRWETIKSFRDYCERTGKFRTDQNNERVTRRLARILQKYLALGSGSRSAAVISQLAEAAYAEIPAV